MAKFSNKLSSDEYAKAQAVNLLKPIQGKGNILEASGTVNAYENALRVAAKYCNNTLNCSLREITKDQAIQYLNERKQVVSQKTLDKDRQALQSVMQNVTKALNPSEKLPTGIKSTIIMNETSRIYTPEQVDLVCQRLSEKNELAVRIIEETGLRAMETLEIERRCDREPTSRPCKAQVEKFKDTNAHTKVEYTVKGKGGLVRNFYLSQSLSDRLEATRLQTPEHHFSRGTHRNSHYAIGGGAALSKAFTIASQKTLGWSRGIHGLRHSYAQRRMEELKKTTDKIEAKSIVSQEVGHFRPDITDTYLR